MVRVPVRTCWTLLFWVKVPDDPPSQVTVAAKAGEGVKRKRNSIVIPVQAGIHLNKNLAGVRTLLLCNRFRIKCGMTGGSRG